MRVPEVERLSKKLSECLDGRDRMTTHAEHLQKDLLEILETVTRIRRLLARWRQDRIYLQDYALSSPIRTAQLNALEKQIEELEVALNAIPLFAEDPPKEEK